MEPVKKSRKLNNVCYDIRGPVMEAAQKLEREGHSIVKLNTGNPAHFGFSPPENMKANILANMPRTEAYVDSQGIVSARQVVLEQLAYAEEGHERQEGDDERGPARPVRLRAAEAEQGEQEQGRKGQIGHHVRGLRGHCWPI